MLILDRALGRWGYTLDRVLMLVAAEAEIVRRLSGRRTCPKCAAVYHVDSRPPASPGICDLDGSALVERADDAEQVVRERLRIYAEQTLPVAQAYRERGLLREVDSSGIPETILARLEASLDAA